MRQLRYLLLVAVVAAATLSTGCGEPESSAPVRTFAMGERITLGHIVYTVYETQWMTHLGNGAEAHVPQNRYFLVRMSATNSSNREFIVPNLTLEDDNGTSWHRARRSSHRVSPARLDPPWQGKAPGR